MVGGFAWRNTAIVTVTAAAANTGVIVYRISKGIGVVTVVATIARRGVGGGFARSLTAIVTAYTGAHYFYMIDPWHGGKCAGIVAGFTVVGGRYMGGVFSQ